MTIYLAADHAGFALKEAVKAQLLKGKDEVIDCGANTLDPADDYPDYIAKAAALVASNHESRAFIFGGSGQGEAMVANRYKGVRCAVFYGPVKPKEAVDVEGHNSDDPFIIIHLERQHNNANMLSFGARFVSTEEALKAVTEFLATPFSNADRHIRRLNKF